MRRQPRLKRNQPCPCGRVKKYKKCCWGKVDWAKIISTPDPVKKSTHLSMRGKNIMFLECLASALQLDRKRQPSLRQFKRAFTPRAVREIFSSVAAVWHEGEQLERVLRQEREATSGLYVGVYEPQRILRGITRHSLYTERILLVDPFMNPLFVRDEFSPLYHPEQHRSTALRWAWLWLMMAPWVDADLVHFIRTPGDFDTKLAAEAYRITNLRYQRYPKLKSQLAGELENDPEILASYQRQILLSMPDEHFRQLIREQGLTSSEAELEQVVRAIRATAENDPFVLEPVEGSDQELLQASSGTSYEMAKWTSALSGSHLITDIASRWAEIEVDRREAGIGDNVWTPFAKAFGGVGFTFLNNVPIDTALTLRKEGHLQDLRTCLGKAWRACRDEDAFADSNVRNLTGELEDQMRLADAEWIDIKASLAQMIGTEVAAAVGGASAVLTGEAQWVAGGLAAGGTVAAGITGTVVRKLRRGAYMKRHPASFFLGLSK